MNNAALATLVKTHDKRIRRFLNRRGASPSTIDDVAQELWLRILRLVDEDEIQHPISYLYRTARNILSTRKSLCSERKEHCDVDDLINELLLDDPTEDVILDAQMRMTVRCAVGQLPPRQREMLLMHMGGLTYKQIAAAKDLTCRTVLRQLRRAYETLRSDPTLAELIS